MQYEYFKKRLELLEKRYISLKNANVKCTKIKDLMFLVIEIDEQTECICLNNNF